MTRFHFRRPADHRALVLRAQARGHQERLRRVPVHKHLVEQGPRIRGRTAEDRRSFRTAVVRGGAPEPRLSLVLPARPETRKADPDPCAPARLGTTKHPCAGRIVRSQIASSRTSSTQSARSYPPRGIASLTHYRAVQYRRPTNVPSKNAITNECRGAANVIRRK
jgi:hypothetical protein